MYRPKSPWPDEKEVQRRFKESKRIGHTQLHIKCKQCGLEFLIMTWRTGAEIPVAFGIYADINPVADRGKLKDGKGNLITLDPHMPAAQVPEASQLVCPECGERGSCYMIGYRRAKGPIHKLGM